jgi:hypothetical protein
VPEIRPYDKPLNLSASPPSRHQTSSFPLRLLYILLLSLPIIDIPPRTISTNNIRSKVLTALDQVKGMTGPQPAFEMVVLGSGGGPLETDTSGCVRQQMSGSCECFY